MIDDALLAKFDRIQDLPVSEEMLGAYLENSLSDDEAGSFGGIIEDSDYLNDLIEIIQEDLTNGALVRDDTTILDGVLDWIDLPQTETYVNGIESYNSTHPMDSDFDELFSSNHIENGFCLDDDDSFHDDYDSLVSDDI